MRLSNRDCDMSVRPLENCVCVLYIQGRSKGFKTREVVTVDVTEEASQRRPFIRVRTKVVNYRRLATVF